MTGERKETRPILGITLGDPSGIGPEVLIKALAGEAVYQACRPLVLGDAGVLAETGFRLGLALELREISEPEESQGRLGMVELLVLSRLATVDRAPGRPGLTGGRAAARYIETGARLALAGRIQGLVTGPISKASLNAAGYAYAGHTEMLAALAGGVEVAMMLAGPRLRVVLVTTHLALRDVPARLSAERVLRTAEIADAALRRQFGLERPRLALAALNPHASDSGLFGDEEERILAPAALQAAARGVNLAGPFPADTLLYRAAHGEFDAVICLYHDQALIPFKLLHFSDGVNVTLGLPFIRTSVDHGTAFDLAGRGLADPSSMKAAILLAADLAARAQKWGKSS
jgi:4-hydroxythreonine-4-phosphate dehydrogenase